MNNELNQLDIQDILQLLPHRYPFLLIDRVLAVTPGQSLTGLKNVTFNEPFFQGHFPGHPVMPGVLILEAMAQVGAVVVLKMPEFAGKIALFAGMDKVRFRRQVVPGDVLRIEVQVQKLRGTFGKSYAAAYVGDEMAAEAEMMFGLQK